MKNPHILLVPVGGTICTLADEKNERKVSTEGAKRLLIENFRRSSSPFARSAQFTVGESMDTLSENMSVSVWNAMLAYMRTLSLADYDGVIVAHGTDTLAYSASLFSFLLASIPVPVFFVAANAPLDDPATNGNENFRAAVECVGYGMTAGVYVPYRNPSDGKTYLHLASRLRQCSAYSEDFFGEGAIDISERDERVCARPFAVTPCKKACEGVHSLRPCVLKIDPYVGLDYGVYASILQSDDTQIKAVLHTTYHSGTVCTGYQNGKNSPFVSKGDSATQLLAVAQERKIPLYLHPLTLAGATYESLTPLRGGILPLYGTTAEAAYAKLLIAYSTFDDAQEISDFLHREINGEFCYR